MGWYQAPRLRKLCLQTKTSCAFAGAGCASLEAYPDCLQTLLFHVPFVNYPHCAFAIPASKRQAEGTHSVLCLLLSPAHDGKASAAARESMVLLPPEPLPQKKPAKRQPKADTPLLLSWKCIMLEQQRKTMP